MEKIIWLENICFSYDSDKPFIQDLNLNIYKGSYTCIVGSNGSGKSTLAKLIAGLLPSYKGDIFIEGNILCNSNMNTIRDLVGVIFQNPENQYVASSLKEDIIFGLENHNVNPSDMDEIVNRVSKECMVSDLLDKEPSAMSGGQKQKGAIAGIIALNPKILILDEATSMLDPYSRKEINNLILKLKKEKGLTIISISHDSEELLLADRVVALSKGNVIFDGTRDEYYNFDVSKYGLRLPKIIELEKMLGYKEYVSEERFIKGDKYESKV